MYIKELARVLRYSMDTVTNLLQQLHENPYARTVVADANTNLSNNHHLLQRHITADALTDQLGENDPQVELLKSPNQHVVVEGGRVRAGRVVHQPMRTAFNNAIYYLLHYVNPEIPVMTDWLTDYSSPNLMKVNVSHYDGDEPRPAVSVHRAELGQYLHDYLENRFRTQNPDHYDETSDRHGPAMQALINAQYEEVDPEHHTERTYLRLH